MATKVFFRAAQGTTPYQWSSGTNNNAISGSPPPSSQGWDTKSLTTTQGSSFNSAAASTVAGPTSGIEVSGGGSLPVTFVSAPIDADVTISGTITFNLWAFEANMNDNVAINCYIDRVDSTGALSRVVTTARTTEVALGTAAVNNFTATPTSTAFNKGDRIRATVFIDDAGTMGAGGSGTFDYDAGAGVDGDSFVSFTETFGFLTSDPSTTTIYPTDTASDVSTASVDREAWTSRGATVANDITATSAGWTAPIQVTDTNGGTVVDWFTKQLTAFTLSGPVLVNARVYENASTANAAIRAELAVVASDGTSPTVWAATSHPSELALTETAYQFYLAGDDLAVSDGQRLRIRFYGDDSSTTAMGSGTAFTLWYAGTSGGASGDTFLIFGQTLTEYVAAPSAVYTVPRNVSHPGPRHLRDMGPPILAQQKWLDYTAPTTSTTVDVGTAGQITLTGQSTAFVQSQSLVAGALTFTGATIALSQSQAVAPGAITFTGQSLAFTTTVSVTAGQMTFTGGDIPLIVDVPHAPVTFPRLTRMDKILGPRGPPVLLHQSFPSYAAGVVTTTVDVSTAGAITFTGQDVAFTQTQSVVAGQVTFTGQSVGVVSVLPTGAGAITFTGQTVAFQQAQSVTAGQVTFTGQSAAFTQTQAVTAGAITFTGQTVTLISATVVSVTTAGAITFTGQSVALVQTQSIVAGAITFTGQAVGLSQAQSVTAGLITFSGQTVTGVTVSSVTTAGAITFAGQSAPTTQTQNVVAGAITFSGGDITFSVTQPTPPTGFPQLPVLKVGFRGPPILARQRFDAPAPAVTTSVDVSTAGAITFTGQSVGLTQSQSVTAGAFTLTGQDVAFRTSVPVSTSGAVTFTGQAVGLSQSQSVTAGQVTFTGQSVAFKTTAGLTAGLITFAGQTVSVGGTTTVNVATAGALTFAGGSIGLTKVAGVTGGLVTFSGSSVGVSVTLSLTSGQITFTGSTITIVAPGGGVVLPITREGFYSRSIVVEGSTTSIQKEGRWGPLTGLPEPVGASGTGPGSASAPALTGTEFDITDYGAAINGTTNDSAAWVSAIAAASAVGGTVLHPGGTSAVGTMIAVPSNVTIAGVGPSSVIKGLAGLTSTYVFDVRGNDVGPVSVDNVTFRDLRFDMNTVSQAGAVVYRRNNDLLFDRCWFSNSAWYYIHESSGVADGLVPLADEVMVRDCTFDTHTGGSRECVLAGYVTNFTVLRCRFIGTNLGFSIYRAATGTVVQDCDFDTITGSNPNAILYGRGCDNITITNCSFTAVGTTGSAAIRGCQPGDDYITGGGLGLPDYMANLTVSHCTFTGCGVAYQVGAVQGFRDLSNLVQTSLGTGVLVNSGNTSANFAGYPSRDLTFYGSEYLSNMQTAGSAAVFFNSTQAGVNLQMVARRNTFADAGVTQTRAFNFTGNGTPSQSIFSGASIDTSNTSNVQLIRLLSTATGVTLETTGPYIFSEGAWVPTITKRGRYKP